MFLSLVERRATSTDLFSEEGQAVINFIDKGVPVR